jgi:ABC-type multidrug transport system permease subunit
MSFLLTCTAKDLRRRLADPLALLIWIGIPLLIGGLMTVMFGGQDGAPPKAHVLLVDLDDSIAGQAIGGLGGGRGAEFLDVETVGLDEGRARMDAGEASALVILPAGFSQAVFEQEPTTIELVKNPAQIILPGIVEEGLEVLVELVHYAQRLFAEPLEQIQGIPADATGFLPSDAVALFSGSVNDRLSSVGDWLFPPALDVEFVNPDAAGEDEAAAGSVNIGALFLPSMMFMSLLFIAQGMADDLWDEKEAGTLRRAVALPHAIGAFLASKLLAAALIMTAVGLAALGVLLAIDAVTLARLPVALAWAVFGGTALFCFFLALQFLASSRRGAAVLSNVVLFPVMMIGGAFFPFEAMPAWMQAVGRWTPNGQALVRFRELLAGTAALETLAVSVLAIGLPAAAVFVLSTRVLGRRFAGGA